MLIRHLKFFVALAEEQHFGRAAERCHVTQPTLSQAIRKLEDDLNLTLIIRGHRFMSLTPEGEKVLHWGRQILTDYDSLHDDLSGRTRGGLTGMLRLGVIPTALPMVALLSEAFQARHPLAEIDIRAMSSRAIQRSIETFEIDGGLTYLDSAGVDGLRRIPLYEERYVFACRADHPFATEQSVTWAAAVTQPLCLLSDDMQHRHILNSIAESAGLVLRPKVVSNSFVGVASHLRAGGWCAIVPHTFAFLFGDAKDLVMKEMVTPLHRQQIGLALAGRSPQSPMALALQQSMQAIDVTRRFAMTFGCSGDTGSDATCLPASAGMDL